MAIGLPSKALSATRALLLVWIRRKGKVQFEVLSSNEYVGEEMNIFQGFGFTGYRSFYDELQFISPITKVNLLAGQNNSGKSNILRFATRFLRDGLNPTGLDIPQTSAAEQAAWAIAVDPSSDEFVERIRALQPGQYESQRKNIEQLFDSPSFHLTGDDLIWFVYDSNYSNPSQDQALNIVKDLPIASVPQQITHNLWGEYSSSQPANVINFVNRLRLHEILPRVQFIDAFRQIRQIEGVSGTSGENLIDDLARLQNPEITPSYKDDEHLFGEINTFLQVILDDPDARLRIPHNRKEIQVLQNGSLLPLDHYGTGIHQVVILAAAATIHRDHLLCIEEPEVHLHPLLQRKLINYLLLHTTNKYLIATHSAHILDYTKTTVFDVRRDSSGTSVVRLASKPAQVSEICDNLGYRPSDLLQSNAIIWVEGPSDRIYLTRWINDVDPELVEGIDYSIMFYGGKLLNHLSGDDSIVSDFIELRRLNRKIMIVIDSDKTKPQSKLSATKTRVIEEFNQQMQDSAWVTSGYTIENYVPYDLLNEATFTVHNREITWRGDKWENPLKDVDGYRFDKNKVASYVVSHWLDDHYSKDLRTKVRFVVDFIRTANGLNIDSSKRSRRL
ncbi:AAA family ATPase [Amycolatopsis sp. RTGN1]|uniref:AAA family ATPase n=1 Tax=Amycolatopsis ponsaeliensis TaxID=2992142 RepID=UPI00254EEC8E|nr:AAA family ATPase [Amycolatopsis sp. RTGN1]